MTPSSGRTSFLVAVQAGALGNQLFALATLQHFNQDGRLYLLGYQQLSRFLELDSVAKVYPGRWTFAAARYGVRVLDRLSFLKHLIGEVWESIDGRAIGPTGAKKILLAHDVYFQRWPGKRACEEIWSRIRQEHIDSARKTLTQVIRPDETAVFLHLRRGDYLTWPDPNSPAVLPEDWTFGAL